MGDLKKKKSAKVNHFTVVWGSNDEVLPLYFCGPSLASIVLQRGNLDDGRSGSARNPLRAARSGSPPHVRLQFIRVNEDFNNVWFSTVLSGTHRRVLMDQWRASHEGC